MNFVIGFLLSLLAQTLTFLQLQGQFKFAWMKQNPFLTSLLGIPISYLFIKSVNRLVIHFDGQLWPSRLLGFSIGAIVFTIMSRLLFNEPFTLKTLICLALAFCIMCIQLFMK